MFQIHRNITAKMTNPIIETDLAKLLDRIDSKLDKVSNDVGELKVGQARLEGQMQAMDERLSGQIKAVDERLSGQIKAVDERLSGQIKAIDTKVDQLEKRVGNQEFINRGTFGGIVVIAIGSILTTAAKLLGF